MAEPSPILDPADLRPSVEDVAILERSRTVAATGLGGDGGSGGEWTESSRPSISEVEHLIDLALELIVGQLGPEVGVFQYGQVKSVVALQAAILVEGSFFRETVDRGSVDLWSRLIAAIMPGLQVTTGSVITPEAQQPRRVDSISMRSTMTEDPAYWLGL